jgi:outer membrane protein assembly factor BamB
MKSFDLQRSGRSPYVGPRGPESMVTSTAYATSGQVYSTPVLSSDGAMFVGSNDGHVYKFNCSTGDVVWSYLVGNGMNGVSSSAALSDDGSVLFFGGTDDEFYALSTASAAVLWKTSLGGINVCGAVAFAQAIGLVFFGDTSGDVYAADATTGEIKWHQQCQRAVSGGVSLDPAGATVYVACSVMGVVAFDARSGARKWAFVAPSTSYYFSVVPAVGNDGTLYFGNNCDGMGCPTGTFFALNPNGPVLKWTYATQSEVFGSAAVAADGTVYFGCVLLCKGLQAFLRLSQFRVFSW